MSLTAPQYKKVCRLALSLTASRYMLAPAGELAHWFSSTQALSRPRYELEQLSELQGVLRRRESELATKEDLLARKEEELVAVVAQLEEQSGRAQQLEHERSSEERRRRKLEQAEKDLVSWGMSSASAKRWEEVFHRQQQLGQRGNDLQYTHTTTAIILYQEYIRISSVLLTVHSL